MPIFELKIKTAVKLTQYNPIINKNVCTAKALAASNALIVAHFANCCCSPLGERERAEVRERTAAIMLTRAHQSKITKQLMCIDIDNKSINKYRSVYIFKYELC